MAAMPKNTPNAEAVRIIAALGGTTATARLFEIAPASVSEWRYAGIPKARMQFLRLLRPDLFKSKRSKG